MCIRDSLAATLSSFRSGNLVRIFGTKRSYAGLTAVVVREVDLYATRYLRIYFCHSLPSAWAILVLLSRDLLSLLTSPLACSHSGEIFLCSIVRFSKYCSNTLDLNCGPLSLAIDRGKPWVVNAVSKHPDCLRSCAAHNFHLVVSAEIIDDL